MQGDAAGGRLQITCFHFFVLSSLFSLQLSLKERKQAIGTSHSLWLSELHSRDSLYFPFRRYVILYVFPSTLVSDAGRGTLPLLPCGLSCCLLFSSSRCRRRRRRRCRISLSLELAPALVAIRCFCHFVISPSIFLLSLRETVSGA
jgi:hypothetical protein